MMVWTAAPLSAATVDWGSPLESTFATSTGESFATDFTFELGVFANSFVPTMDNLDQWEANWRTFDIGTFNEEAGWFSGSAQVKANGSSSNPLADVGVNFAEMEAYVWVYNVTSVGLQTQWFLGRSSSWVLPSAPEDDCCDDRLPLQWGIGDMAATGDTPVMGSRSGDAGGGVASDPGAFTIQTHAIPEPGSVLLAVISAAACLRRKRMKSAN